MSYVLYYSNYCDKCKDLLRMLGKTNLKDEIHFLNIDKRFRDNKNGMNYIILENGQSVLLPPMISRVPALMLLKEGNKVIFGNEITGMLKPQSDYYDAAATKFNGEPLAFSMNNDNVGGFGVMSDNFSFWDQSADELLAQGEGGTRQMYNYAGINFNTKIDTPSDDYVPDKVGADSLKKYEEERNKIR
jgi:hypothetical protein